MPKIGLPNSVIFTVSFALHNSYSEALHVMLNVVFARTLKVLLYSYNLLVELYVILTGSVHGEVVLNLTEQFPRTGSLPVVFV